MTILIKKEVSGYSAVVKKLGSNNTEWQSKAPMSSGKLMKTLCDIGCHQIDVVDAFNAADPHWNNVGGMG